MSERAAVLGEIPSGCAEENYTICYSWQKIDIHTTAMASTGIPAKVGLSDPLQSYLNSPGQHNTLLLATRHQLQ